MSTDVVMEEKTVFGDGMEKTLDTMDYSERMWREKSYLVFISMAIARCVLLGISIVGYFFFMHD